MDKYKFKSKVSWRLAFMYLFGASLTALLQVSVFFLALIIPIVYFQNRFETNTYNDALELNDIDVY